MRVTQETDKVFLGFPGIGYIRIPIARKGALTLLVKGCWVCLEDDSMVKSTCCSCGGLWFGPQHPHGGWKSSVNPLAGDPMPFSDLRLLYACGADKTLIHRK